MTKQINTYNDLLEEQARLKELFKVQKQVVRDDLKLIKEEFEPVRKAVGFLGKFAKRDTSNPLLNIASSRAIDLFLRRFVLARAGFLTRLAVPFIAKNITSHFVADRKPQILGTLATWFNKLRGHDPKNPSARKTRNPATRSQTVDLRSTARPQSEQPLTGIRETPPVRPADDLQTDPTLNQRLGD